MAKLEIPPLYTSASAVYSYDPLLEGLLVFKSKYEEEPIKLTRRVGDALFVPRALAPSLGVDKRVVNPLPAISCKVPPNTPEQGACIFKSLELLKADHSHILEATTGTGKTYMGAAIAAALGQTTIIVVSKQDLLDQWRATLTDLVGVPEEEIGIARADKLEYQGKRFVLAMIQSLIREGKYDSEFFNYFGFAIFDETHRVAADVFSNVAFLLPAKYRLGLSATPKRPDGKSPVILAHIGPVLVNLKLVPMKPKILVKRTQWKIPKWMTFIEPGKMAPVYKAMSHSEDRNRHIILFVKKAYEAGRTVVVMADHIVYLRWLQVLCRANGVPDEDIGTYISETTGNKAERELNAHKRVIFATYGMAQEGTDYPHWDTLVMATPRSNVKQPLGRILRSKPGKKTPVCLDLVDEGKIFDAFRWKRVQTYHEVGAQIVELP